MSPSPVKTEQQEAIVQSDAACIVVVAGPGSGKSTTLVGRIKRLIMCGVEPGAIMVLSFTTNAAAVLRDRLGALPLHHVGTLHGYLLKLITQHGLKIGYGKPTILDEESGDELLMGIAKEQKCRDSMERLRAMILMGIPKAGTVDRATVTVRRFYDALRRDNLLTHDVTLVMGLRLMVELNKTPDLCPAQHLMVDEYQDSGDLDDAIYDALPVPNKFFVGDLDQCQPAGTMVRMANTGYSDDGIEKPIESLNVGDLVVSYDRKGKTLIGSRKITAIQRRFYVGNLYTISAGEKETSCTPNHKWLIKWKSGAERTQDVWCVYMMRKGDNFRIGKTLFFRSGGITGKTKERTKFCVIGVTLRARQEQADAVWVLSIHHSNKDATAHEDIAIAKYGLPGTCFKATEHTAYTQETIDHIFNSVPNQFPKAVRCLQDHGRELEFPLFSIHQKRTRRTVQEVHACNLLDDVMHVPVFSGPYDSKNRSGEWNKITVKVNHFTGHVYSLDVEKDHKYIADGIVTCNSIFQFRGAVPQNMLDRSKAPGTTLLLMEQNFRSDQHICRAAQRLIERGLNRINKVTKSVSAHDGTVEHIACRDEAEELNVMARSIAMAGQDPNETAILCRTNKAVQYYQNALPGRGVEVQRERGAPRRLGDVLMLIRFLSDPDNDFVAKQWLTKLHGQDKANQMSLEAKQTFDSLNKKFFKLQPTAPRDLLGTIPKVNPSILSIETVDLLRLKIAEIGPDGTAQDLLIALQDDAPEEKQTGVRCMTIHRSKGQEFDSVLLPWFEDQTIPGHRVENLEEERRLAFVAITRARHRVLMTSVAARQNPYTNRLENRTPSRFIREAGL